MSARPPVRPEPVEGLARTVLGLLGGLLLACASAFAATDPQVTRGEYLARAGDCISCHTRPQGAPYAGGLPMKTPFGTIFSTNITPDKEQGIGQYTQEEFSRVLRQGRARDGHYLYPAMPYTNFSRLGDEDVAALYAFFMHGVPAAKQDNTQTDLSWPFSMRWLMAGWNMLYLPGKPYEPEPAQSAEWNRGAYLVLGLGHCSACHTPRGVTGAEKGTTEKSGNFLTGALIDGWYAQPLRGTSLPGLGTWTREDVVDFLKTGRNHRTAAFGAMTEVVGNSTQYLTREDLGAIATYLKSITDQGMQPASSTPSTSTETTMAMALREGHTEAKGSLVFLNNCAGCHKSSGTGSQRTFPSLAQNSAVAAKDPTSLIRIVLQGSSMASTGEAPSALGMPGFGWRLTDENIAELLSFVRSSWGNAAAPVSAGEVAKVRGELIKTAGR